MSFSNWLSGDVATANLATFATESGDTSSTVANVAEIAVAKSKKVEIHDQKECGLRDQNLGFGDVATANPATFATEPPPFCTRETCSQFEVINLPGLGMTPGCIIKSEDYETWRRLDKIIFCPYQSEKKKQAFMTP